MVLLLWAATLALGACEERRSYDDLVAAVADAESAYADLDLTTFHDASVQITETLACLSDLLSPPLAARIHRIAGLTARMKELPDDARLAFVAARSLDPRFRFPTESPVTADYLAIPLVVGRNTPVPVPQTGSLYFDGRQGLERPAAWPTLFQRLDGDGSLVATAVLWPEDPLPEYPVAPETAGKKQRSGLSAGTIGWLAESLVATGVGVAMYSTASGAWADARCQGGAASQSAADLCNSVRTRYLWGAALMGVGGAGLVGAGVTAAFSGSW